MGSSTSEVGFRLSIKRWILVALWSSLGFSGLAHSEFAATDRVLQFLVNAHTGVAMKPGEWLTQEMQASNAFGGFGGIDRMVTQSTRLAHEYGGLRSLRIVNVTSKDAHLLIRAEVTFVDDARRQKSASSAERGNMIWNIRATKATSGWMLAF